MEVTHADGGTQGEQQQAPETGGGGFDPSALQPLQERIDQLGRSLDQRFETLDQRLPPAEDPYNRNDVGQFAGQDQFGQQPGMVPGMPGQFGQQAPPGTPAQYMDEYGDLTPEGMQAMVQQSLGPMQQQFTQQMQAMQQQMQQQANTIQEITLDRGAETLEAEFPELKDQKNADALIEYAAQLGRPDLVGDPRFLRMAHMAQRAEQAGQQETPATPGPSLEPAGGASLATGELTRQERIKNAGTTNKVWGF